jgi:hypothetical protein
MAVVVRQQGAGNGKSHDLVRSIVEGSAHAIVLTKPHTNKDMLYAEMMRAAVGARAENKSRAWVVEFDGASGPRRAVFATVDSFMFAIGDPTRGGRAFDSAVRSVDEAQLARTVQRDEDGAWLRFKGERIRVDRSVVLVDEAQDLDLTYVRALEAYARYTDTRVVLIGDKMQSIQYERNAFTETDGAFEREPPRNACRRFGPSIAGVVNRLVFHDPANARWIGGAPPITALGASRDNAVAVVKVPCVRRADADADAVARTLDAVMAALAHEHEQGKVASPRELLVVSPFVRNDRVMDALEMHIAAFWAERGVPDGAYLHVSEPGHPVNLEHSRDATRLVSIHASKGDGRRVVFVVGLTEQALARFSDAETPSESLVYLSLLHVALTRAEDAMYVFLHDREDDVTRRFHRAGLIGDDWAVDRCVAWPSRPTLLRDMAGGAHGSAMRETMAGVVPAAAPTAPSAATTSDAVHHYIEYSCMVIGAITHVIDACRTEGTIAELYADVGSQMRAAKCVDMTHDAYVRAYIFARDPPRGSVPIVTNEHAAELRALVEAAKGRKRPVTPLDMCVTLYVLGHAYPNMIDPTRGMYRPLAMYRVLRWFAGAAGDLGPHVDRLLRLDALMRRAVAFAGDAVWSVDHRKPYRLSSASDFDLTALNQVIFQFRSCEVAYVVHLHCRFHADPYTNAIEALVDAVVHERRVDLPAACLVLALDAGEPFVVWPPADPRPLLDFVRAAMRAHFARLNAELARGVVKKRIPRYASRLVASGATDAATLDAALDAAIEIYVDNIGGRKHAIFVTDVADRVRDDMFHAEPVAPVFAPYTGPPLSRDEARACGVAAPELAFGACTSPCAATDHGARAARAALASLCASPKREVSLRHVRDGRALIGRADAVGACGTVIEFKLRVSQTALRQVACYLAMIGGGSGFVVGLHDAAVHRVTVVDPGPILAACF